MCFLSRSGVLLLAVAGLFSESLYAADPEYRPGIAEASNDGERAIQSFRIPDGMTGSLFAAEPMVANPVAFCFDEQGRIYVAETFRQKQGLLDTSAQSPVR
jgi:quinoprotein glucose dehydrogenase